MIKPYFRRMIDPYLLSKNLARIDRRKRVLYVDRDPSHKLKNSEVLSNLNSKRVHLPTAKKDALTVLTSEYECLFSNVPMASHDVDVRDTKPIKQNPQTAKLVGMKYNIC